MNPSVRLQKILASSGITSRRKSEKLIKEGRVTVNGQVVTRLGTKAVPEKDIIHLDGRRIQSPERIYLMLNKPNGYLSTARDERGRRTVIDLVPRNGSIRLWPCGRLDKSSTGLILLTNDGELAYRLTHPKFEVEKSYLVQVKGKITPRALNSLRRGIVIQGQRTKEAKVRPIRSDKNSSSLEITIHEGRKRQIRLMCQAVGHPVIMLKRIRYGPLRLNNLKVSFWRSLTQDEIANLKKEAYRSNKRSA